MAARGVELSVADLHHQGGACGETSALLEEARERGGAGAGGEECQGRLEIANLEGEGGSLFLIYIGGVADGEVEPGEVEAGDKVGTDEVDAVADSVSSGVAGSHGERAGREVGRHHEGARDFESESDG